MIFNKSFTLLTAKATDDADKITKCYINAVTHTLDRHASSTERTCSNRARQPWYNSEIHSERRVRRKLEKKWRKTGLEVDHQCYVEQNKTVNSMIEESKKSYMQSKLQTSDTKSMFRTVNTLLNKNKTVLPSSDSPKALSNNFSLYFREKVDNVHKGLLNEQCNSSNKSSLSVYDHEVSCKLSEFDMLSEEDVESLIKGLSTKSCMLDPIPTWYLKDNVSTFVPAISNVINTSLSTGEFPMSLKRAVITPIIKKPSLDPDELKNYRPVSSLPFLSKVIERQVVNTITDHMIDNNLGAPLQ